MKKIAGIISFVLCLIMLAGTICLASDATVPSIEAKAAPEVIEILAVDKAGKQIVAEVVVTPYADARLDSTPQRTKEALEKAYSEVTGVKSLKELNKDLDKVAKSIDSTYAANVFVVSELFDVTVSPYIKEALENGGSITITFDTNYTSKPVVLHRMESGGWEIIDDSKVSLKGGKLVVEFTSLSPIAFLSVSAEKIEEGNKKKNITMAVVFVVLIVLIAAVIVIILLLQDRKKKEPDNIEKIEKSDE